MDFTNEIILNGQFGPNGLALTSKVARSYRAGLEIDGWNQLHPNIKVTHALSYNKSEIKENDLTFSPILYPQIIWFEEVELRVNKLHIALNGRYQSSSYMDFANSEKLDDYLLLNARVAYDVNDHLGVNLFLNNLTNQQYFNNGYVDYDGTPKYFIQAPINYYLSATWKF